MRSQPSVSIIVPCRNEALHITACLESILAQKDVLNGFEVLVADGMSNDGTREILERFSERDERVRVIDNPQQIVSTGLNAAIRVAKGEVLIRMDAHAEYAADYIHHCVKVLNETGAENVGGPWRAAGKTFLQHAIALAFQSAFSSGGAGSHNTEYEGEVDSVFLGCWTKSTLERVGFFDEELVRNQDDELNLRIIRSGGKVWQSPHIKSYYYPRPSLLALFKQYMQYGYWKVRVIQKHKLPASIRHLVPGLFLGTLFVLFVLSFFSSLAAMLLAILSCAYMAVNLFVSLLVCREPKRWKYLPVMPLVFAAYHFGYGFGFLRGVLDFIFLQKRGSETFSQITRG